MRVYAYIACALAVWLSSGEFVTAQFPPCETLRNTSICASILPYTQVSFVAPSVMCQEEVERRLLSVPTLWRAINVSAHLSPTITPTTSNDLAMLMCMAAYRPCGSPICRSVCNKVFGNGVTEYANGVRAQYGALTPFVGLLRPMIDGFDMLFTCDLVFPDGSSLYVNDTTPTERASCYAPTKQPKRVPMPTCETYTGSVCKGVINHKVYISPLFSQQSVEANISFVQPLFALAPVATGCRENLASVICSYAFPKCDDTVFPTQLGAPVAAPFPQLPCQSLCQKTLKSCATLIGTVPDLLKVLNCDFVGVNYIQPQYTCNNVKVTKGEPDFPESITWFNSTPSAAPVYTKCNDAVQPYGVNVSYICPSPLVYPPTYEDALMGGSCAVPCPSFVFSESEWQTSNTLMYVLVIPAFMLSTFVVVTWLIFPVKDG